MKFLGVFSITKDTHRRARDHGDHRSRRVRVFADGQALANELGGEACVNKGKKSVIARGAVVVEAIETSAGSDTYPVSEETIT